MITVEEVSGRVAMRRFVELPHALHHDDPRWATPVLAYEQWRLDPHRNPFFDRGDAVYLLARRHGAIVGRITAHVREERDQGWFGFYDVADDRTVVEALLDAAQAWLAERGCRSMTGPVSFTEADDAGVQVAGHAVHGMTGRQWHPEWYATRLEEAGLVAVRDLPRWRLATTAAPHAATAPVSRIYEPLPPHAGRYGDPRLVLAGIAAVPDVSAAMAVGGVRSTLRTARALREARWTQCCVVRSDEAALSSAVPLLLERAGAGGYEWVVAPWSGDGLAVPETVHRIFRREW